MKLLPPRPRPKPRFLIAGLLGYVFMYGIAVCSNPGMVYCNWLFLALVVLKHCVCHPVQTLIAVNYECVTPGVLRKNYCTVHSTTVFPVGSCAIYCRTKLRKLLPPKRRPAPGFLIAGLAEKKCFSPGMVDWLKLFLAPVVFWSLLFFCIVNAMQAAQLEFDIYCILMLYCLFQGNSIQEWDSKPWWYTVPNASE